MDERTHEALSRTSRLINLQFFGGLADERALSAALTTLTARIVCDGANATTTSGQHLVVTLALLLARSGISVELAVPDIELLAPQPPLTGDTLRTALMDCGGELVPGVGIGRDLGPAFITFVVGDTVHRVSQEVLRLSGDEWGFEIAPAAVARGNRWTGRLPFSPLACAAAAAAEALRAALPLISDRAGGQLVADAHRLAIGQTIALDLRDLFPTLEPGLDLREIDAVSGGAITNAALYVLRRTPGVLGKVRVIEAEALDLSNINRYMLVVRRHVGMAKTEILESYAGGGLQVAGVPLRLEERTIEEIGPLADRVLVGVDHIPSRWLIQREAPAWVAVGSTQSLDVLVSSHGLGEACAGCLHPRDIDNDAVVPTISFVSFWAGLLLALELLCETTDQTPHPQAIFAWPFGYNGPHLMRLPVAAQPACPVGCEASRRKAA
jgi:hypothetical protein